MCALHLSGRTVSVQLMKNCLMKNRKHFWNVSHLAQSNVSLFGSLFHGQDAVCNYAVGTSDCELRL